MIADTETALLHFIRKGQRGDFGRLFFDDITTIPRTLAELTAMEEDPGDLGSNRPEEPVLERWDMGQLEQKMIKEKRMEKRAKTLEAMKSKKTK